MNSYLIGLGSNLDPFINIPRMIRGMFAVSNKVVISRFVATEPVGMDTENRFLNGVAFMETSLDRVNLKTYFNRLETRLGRDRTNPDKKTADRQADFDILDQIDASVPFTVANLPQEPYCQEVLEELLQAIGLWNPIRNVVPEGASIRFGDRLIGLQPMQVYPQRPEALSGYSWSTHSPKPLARPKRRLHSTS